MNHKEALEAVSKKLPKERFLHTERVYKVAIELAERYSVDGEKAGLAAILHDYAKCESFRDLEEAIRKLDLDPIILTFSRPTWHAFAGAYFAREQLGVNDQEVLQSIMYHTTGHKDMTDMDKIVYLADLIEPSRTFRGIEVIRKLAFENLDKAMFEAARQSLQFLIQRGTPVASYSLDVYNKYASETERK